MDIKLKLYSPFVTALNRLRSKYGEIFERMNGFHNSNLNFSDFIDNFIDSATVADTSIDANANSSTHDVRTLISDMTKPHTKLLAFNKIFFELTKKYGLATAEKWLEDEWSGALYLHDAPSSSFIPYCYAYDLDKVVEKGLFFINKFKTDPPRHLTTFNDHVLEFISWASNRSSGAVGLPSYLLYSYYFWHNDVQNGFFLKDPEYYRRQCFQKFIYDLNQPYLRITECAFTNISVMDRNYLIELFGGRTFPNGEFVIDHIDEIIEHQKVFMEVVSNTRKNTMMTFPVLTYSLLYQNGKFVDEEFARWCNRHNMEWYDSNFYVGSDVTSLSNCCRLLSNTSKLNAFINSIGGTSLSIGSVKVNTINLRRIALESKRDKEKYIEILNERIDTCVKALDVVRSIIKRNIDKGLLPNYTFGLVEMEKQYNTIGITAMYEALNEFGFINTDELGYKYYSEDAMDFAKRILDTINQKKDSYGFDYSINVECIPAERANVVLCNKDNELYSEIDEYFIYSNQWIPLMERCTLNEKIRLGAILDKECGGGQISHINLEGKFANEEQAWELLNRIAAAGVIYFAYNCKISICKDEHAFFGSTCPEDGLPATDTYSRIVGFLVPTSSYSKERKKEFDQRKWFSLDRDL
jgi:ribonucleoside-triphosphate reductase